MDQLKLCAKFSPFSSSIMSSQKVHPFNPMKKHRAFAAKSGHQRQRSSSSMKTRQTSDQLVVFHYRKAWTWKESPQIWLDGAQAPIFFFQTSLKISWQYTRRPIYTEKGGKPEVYTLYYYLSLTTAHSSSPFPLKSSDRTNWDWSNGLPKAKNRRNVTMVLANKQCIGWKPLNLPYICIVWFPQNGPHLMIPDSSGMDWV